MKNEDHLTGGAILDLGRVPGERRLSILAVGARQCRWPVADDSTVIGGILCCAAPTDATYCIAHRKLSYPDRQHPSARRHSPPATRMSHTVADRKAIGSATRDAA